jgi:hypothetical protein
VQSKTVLRWVPVRPSLSAYRPLTLIPWPMNPWTSLAKVVVLPEVVALAIAWRCCFRRSRPRHRQAPCWIRDLGMGGRDNLRTPDTRVASTCSELRRPKETASCTGGGCAAAALEDGLFSSTLWYCFYSQNVGELLTDCDGYPLHADLNLKFHMYSPLPICRLNRANRWSNHSWREAPGSQPIQSNLLKRDRPIPQADIVRPLLCGICRFTWVLIAEPWLRVGTPPEHPHAIACPVD